MATSIRSSSIGNAATGTAMSVAAPSGTATGDVVLCLTNTNNASTVTDNNGSTPFTTDLNNYVYGGGTGGDLYVFSRRIQTGDPSTYNFTQSGATRWTIIAIAIQNPDPTTIYDVAPSAGNFSTGSTSTFSASSITTNYANAINIIMAGIDNASQTITATPAGYTVLQNGGSQTMAAVALTITSPGATGSQSFTQSTGNPYGTGQFAIFAQQAATAKKGNLLTLGVA